MNLLLGDLVLVRGTGIIPKAIESVSHSKYSHAAGVAKPFELIESQGFRKTGYQAVDAYDGQADVYRYEGLTDAQLRRITRYVTQEVGSRYDYLLIGWELIRYSLNIMLPYREPPQARICSTLWADAYRYAGIDLCPNIKYPSPEDLAESKLLKKIGSY